MTAKYLCVLIVGMVAHCGGVFARSSPIDTCNAVSTSALIDCGVPGITEEQCAERGCCFNTANSPNCFYPGYGVPIKTVHVVQACHLDVGFANTAAGIVNLYFDTHFPHAISWAKQLREQTKSPARLKFMTQSYLVSLFLDCPSGMGLHCPNASYVEDFKAAVERGDITYHAFPFNAELEMMDPHQVGFGVQLTHDLDKQFGLPPKITLSQRDVPGMTRSVIPVLKEAGVEAITVGVNTASTPPNVARAFMWRDPVSNEVMPAMWHPKGYGGTGLTDAVVVPNLEHALVFEWNGDNAGPPTVDDMVSTFAAVAKEFPGAQVVASTFDNFTQHLMTVTDTLPVVSTEIGDTWVYGTPSDPYKVQEMREISRLRSACIEDGSCTNSDAQFYNFSRLFLKSSEHTWGKDVKTFLHDWTNWSNAKFQKQRLTAANFLDIEASWVEQRNWGINFPVQALGDSPLAAKIAKGIADLAPPAPPTPKSAGFAPVSPSDGPFSCGRMSVGFDAQTGAINHLVDSATSRVWATASNKLAEMRYTTYDAADYATFMKEYIDVHPTPSWAGKDFGKPNVTLANPKSATVAPTLQGLWMKKPASAGAATEFLAELQFPAASVTDAGAPAVVWAHTVVPSGSTARTAADSAGMLNVTLLMYNKTATRLPESMAVVFNAVVTGASKAFQNGTTLGWAMDKLGEWVSPNDVQSGGSQHLHAVTRGVRYSATPAPGKVAPAGVGSPGVGGFELDSWDAGVVDWSSPLSAFPAPCVEAPDLSQGPAIVLWDNLWGTNYVMWAPFNGGSEDDFQFRFDMRMW